MKSETDRRDGAGTGPAQAELNRKALEQVRDNPGPDHRPEPDGIDTVPTTDGPANTPRPDQPPSGALDAEGHRPVLERSRKVR